MRCTAVRDRQWRRAVARGLILVVLCAGTTRADDSSQTERISEFVETYTADQGASAHEALRGALVTLVAQVSTGPDAAHAVLEDADLLRSLRAAARLASLDIQREIGLLGSALGDAGILKGHATVLQGHLRNQAVVAVTWLGEAVQRGSASSGVVVLEQWKVLLRVGDSGQALLVRAAGALCGFNDRADVHANVKERLWKALGKLLGGAKADVLNPFTTVLGGQACGPVRKALTKAIKRIKKLPAASQVAFLGALGKAGDAGAAPLVLEFVPGTPAGVFEEAIKSLMYLKPEAKRTHARAILDMMILQVGKEMTIAVAKSGSSRQNTPALRRLRAYQGPSLSKVLHMDDDVLYGPHTLHWSVVDVCPELVAMHPAPPVRSGFVSTASGPIAVTTTDWMAWWKVARKKYKGE